MKETPEVVKTLPGGHDVSQCFQHRYLLTLCTMYIYDLLQIYWNIIFLETYILQSRS